MATDLVRLGETIWKFDVGDNGRPELLRSAASTVYGGPRRESWSYTVNVKGPTVTSTVRTLAGETVHVRLHTDPERPWRGVSPLARAAATGNLASQLLDLLDDARRAGSGNKTAAAP